MVHWLRLVREPSHALATMGALYVDGVWRYWTVEDQIREVARRPVAEWKVQNATAIPQGLYRVQLTFSNRFQRITPEIQNVPGFTGIRIHRGNTAADTDGCVLVGFGRVDAMVAGGTSTPAEASLLARLQAFQAAHEPCWIAVENPPVYGAVR